MPLRSTIRGVWKKLSLSSRGCQQQAHDHTTGHTTPHANTHAHDTCKGGQPSNTNRSTVQPAPGTYREQRVRVLVQEVDVRGHHAVAQTVP